MAERKSFLLRVDRELLDAVQRWANDDLRSLNGQIEFLLRRALRDAGRSSVSKRQNNSRSKPRESDSETIEISNKPNKSSKEEAEEQNEN